MESLICHSPPLKSRPKILNPPRGRSYNWKGRRGNRYNLRASPGVRSLRMRFGKPVTNSKKEIARRFNCTKCHARSCLIDDVSIHGGALTRMLPGSSSRYLAVSCSVCGYTEFFNRAAAVYDSQAEKVSSRELVEGTENA